GEGRSHARPRPSGRGVDLRAPPFDVPARAHGQRPGIPPMTDDRTKGDERMDASRNDQLGEIASDAALERTDFLVQATEQLRKFLDRNGKRIQSLGGLTLIDDDPDFLSIAPDLTFRSRSRYLDDDTGEWVSETEIIESAAELVELYNPADVFQAFADAARTASGLPEEP